MGIFHLFVQSKSKNYNYKNNINNNNNNDIKNSNDSNLILPTTVSNGTTNTTTSDRKGIKNVPFKLYLLLSILRAIDAGMTNMAMAYVNYPAKTLMKSSRVVFTMLFGTIIRRKVYKPIDYVVVIFMVSGLVIFMHADSKSSAIFQPIGIMMLTTSLLCDGAINNMSEAIMTQYNVGQDEFIYNLYSIAVCGIIAAAALRGDLNDGLEYMMTPGTLEEIQSNSDVRSWGVTSKFMVICLFSSAGFFGSSCSALITKEFGALTMSITSTARKAMTLFLSFALFNNVCTLEHVSGIALFITALIAKSFRASRGSGNCNNAISVNGKGHDHHGNHDDHNIHPRLDTSHFEAEGLDMSESKKSDSRVKRRLRRRREDVTVDIV